MRMSVTPSLSTKDAVANKNARMTNVLNEKGKAVIRPGMSEVLDYAGVGAGLIPFHGTLLMILDDVLYAGASPQVAFDLSSGNWNSSTTYTIGDSVRYNGVHWTSIVIGNLNNPPADGTYWQTSLPPSWNSNYTYGAGDLVNSVGRVWRSRVASNTGHIPQTGAWWESYWIVIGGITEWDVDTTYDVDDIVSYNGVLYRAQVAGKGVDPSSGGSIMPPVDQYTRRYAAPPYHGGAGFYELATACVVLYQPLTDGRACVVQPEGAIPVYYDNNTLAIPQWVAV